jgi:hypothetical protein
MKRGAPPHTMSQVYVTVVEVFPQHRGCLESPDCLVSRERRNYPDFPAPSKFPENLACRECRALAQCRAWVKYRAWAECWAWVECWALLECQGCREFPGFRGNWVYRQGWGRSATTRSSLRYEMVHQSVCRALSVGI